MTSAKILLAVLFGFVLCLIIVLVVLAFRTQRRRRDKVLVLLLTLAALATGHTTAWAQEACTLSYDATDGYYLNMPTSGAHTLTLTTDDVLAGKGVFKVYDDGGKTGNYSNDVWASLIIYAPSGYTINIKGSMTRPSGDNGDKITVYDSAESTNTLCNVPALHESLGNVDVYSTSNVIGLHFNTNHSGNDSGLDLTVTLIGNVQQYTITLPQSTSAGTITCDKSNNKALQDDIVTLTAQAASGYVLNSMTVLNGDEVVSVTNANFATTTATFQMPAAPVKVQATFTNATTGLFVNMPKTGTITGRIPSGVTSMKIYDDGGADGKYSDNCDGTLTLTAPEGCILKLSGIIKTADGDYVNVYDGIGTNGTKLVSDAYNTTTIPGIFSSGQSMTIRFTSTANYNTTGLDLTVTVVNPSIFHTVTVQNPAAGGSVAASPTSARAGTDVALTVTPNSGFKLAGLSARDENGEPFDIDWHHSFCNVITFKMPEKGLTVIPTFTGNLTAEGGLFVNMPKTGTTTISASDLEGVSSFKVYDDGGAEGNYSINSNGTLTLTAPSGYRLQMEGTLKNGNGSGNAFSVYDGANTNCTALFDRVNSGSGNTLAVSANSSGQSLTLVMETDYQAPYQGLDLTVRVYNPNQTFAISKGTITDGGDISFSVGGSTVTSAHPGDLVTVSVTAPLNYDFDGISVAYQNSGKTVTNIKTSDSSAAFTMPGEAVTVTPIFTHVPDAVNYIDSDGNLASCTRYTALENSNDYVEISAPWVVVKSDVTINGTLYLTNSYCNLILCDGATLTVNNTTGGMGIYADGSLNIYGQSAGTGKLNATSQNWIAIDVAGSINFSGGNITAASNNKPSIIAGNGITINGGTLSANGEGMELARTGAITIGWRSPNDFVSVSKYRANFLNLSIKDGLAMTDGTDIYTGAIHRVNYGTFSIDGKTLRPAVKMTLDTGISATGTTVIIQADDTYAQPGTTVTLGYDEAPAGYDVGYTVKDAHDDDVTVTGNTFTIPVKDVTVSATWTPLETINLTANPADGNYWTTFYHSGAGYSVASGTTAFIAALSGTALTLIPVTDGIIPAGKAVVLKSSASGITLTRTESASTFDFTDNALLGTMTAMTNPDYGHIYVLNYKAATGVGFYKLKETGTIGACKAYLTTCGALTREYFGFTEEEETSLTPNSLTPTLSKGEGVIYDLAGRLVNSSTRQLVNSLKKGIYIVNGKKVLVK